MALSMGCTRRAYFLSSECAMVLWTLAAALLALPAALADEALRPVLAPADARPLLEANPMLGLYRDHFWTVALGALSVVALGQFFGAIIWKWGVTGYWIIWGGSMLLARWRAMPPTRAPGGCTRPHGPSFCAAPRFPLRSGRRCGRGPSQFCFWPCGCFCAARA